MPGSRAAYVEFSILNQIRQIRPWEVRKASPDDISNGVGVVSYTFDSNTPTGFQLEDFTRVILSPRPNITGNMEEMARLMHSLLE